jgi:hypothetical protein
VQIERGHCKYLASIVPTALRVLLELGAREAAAQPQEARRSVGLAALQQSRRTVDRYVAGERQQHIPTPRHFFD